MRCDAGRNAIIAVNHELRNVRKLSLADCVTHAKEMIEPTLDGRLPCLCEDPDVMSICFSRHVTTLNTLQTIQGLYCNKTLLQVCGAIARVADPDSTFGDLEASPPIGIWVIGATAVSHLLYC